jgi:hypothetical protein
MKTLLKLSTVAGVEDFDDCRMVRATDEVRLVGHCERAKPSAGPGAKAAEIDPEPNCLDDLDAVLNERSVYLQL